MDFNMMLWPFFIPYFLFGIVIGSFLNVLIYRLPRKINFVSGSSKCPHCQHFLTPLDLVPLFSYVFLKGQCRYCKQKISPQYPMVEMINALLYMGCFVRYGLSVQSVIYCMICSLLLTIAFIDWQFMIIPDRLNLALAICGAGLLALDFSHWRNKLLGTVVVSGALLVLVILSRGRAMGGGDIKLMAAVGLCFGWEITLLITGLGSVLGTLVLLVLSKTKFALGRKVPFGTFLALAAILCVFWGESAVNWYIGLLGASHLHSAICVH